MIKLKDGQLAKIQLSDIALDISWARISRNYFGKSASWIYNKMNGIDGNGGKGEFSDKEKTQLKDALRDLAERIKKAANALE